LRKRAGGVDDDVGRDGLPDAIGQHIDDEPIGLGDAEDGCLLKPRAKGRIVSACTGQAAGR